MRRMVLAQRFGAVADLALARQEHQHVARTDAAQLFHAIDHGVHQVAFFARGRRALARLVGIRTGAGHRHLLALDGTVAHFHLVQAARHFDHGRRFFGRAEMARKAFGIDGGRGDNDFQVRPARQQLLQIAQQEVDIQAAFVRLIDDDGVVVFQQRIGLRFGQQDTVRHQLDGRALRQGIGKAHLEADRLAQRRAEFLRNALGGRGGGDTARLRVADQAFLAASQFQADLRQLGGLARPRFTGNDDHLVFSEGLGDFGAPARHRQVFRVSNQRQRIAEGFFRLARGAGRIACFAAFARWLPFARRLPFTWRALLLALWFFLLLRARRLRLLPACGRTLAPGAIGRICWHICNNGRRGRLIAG